MIVVLLKVGGGASPIWTCTYKTQQTPRLCICYCFVPQGLWPREIEHDRTKHIDIGVIYVHEVYAKRKQNLLVTYISNYCYKHGC